MFRLKRISAILFSFSLTACGGFDAVDLSSIGSAGTPMAKPYGTCDRKDVATFNLCSEAVGTDYNEVDYLVILQSSCESTGGTYSANNCARTSSLGTCVIDAGLTNETHVTYYPPQYSADTALTACAQNPGGVYYAK